LKRDLQNLISDLWTYKSCPTIKDFENRGVTMIDLGDVPTEYEDYYQCKTHKLVKSENI
jgi:hypothetical protein